MELYVPHKNPMSNGAWMKDRMFNEWSNKRGFWRALHTTSDFATNIPAIDRGSSKKNVTRLYSVMF